MCNCRTLRTVWSVCAHAVVTSQICMKGGSSRSCRKNESIELLLGWCPDCEVDLNKYGDIRTEEAVLNYWLCKSDNGWKSAVDPCLISLRVLFGLPLDVTAELQRPRLENIALAQAIGEHPCGLAARVLEYVEEIRAATLDWARSQIPGKEGFKYPLRYSMISAQGTETCDRQHVVPRISRQVTFEEPSETRGRALKLPKSPYPFTVPRSEHSDDEVSDFAVDEGEIPVITQAVPEKRKRNSLPGLLTPIRIPSFKAPDAPRKPRMLDLYLPKKDGQYSMSSPSPRTPPLSAPPRGKERLATCFKHGKTLKSSGCAHCAELLLDEKAVSPASRPRSAPPFAANEFVGAVQPLCFCDRSENCYTCQQRALSRKFLGDTDWI